MTGGVDVLRAGLAAADRGEPAVLATVVRVEGSAYRRPGARMLIPASGPPTGMVSGGCLEADLAERALAVLSSGAATTAVYDMRSPDDLVWGLGLGCNGEVRVLLERVDRPEVRASMSFLLETLESRRPAVHALVFATEGGAAGGIEVGSRMTIDADGRDVDRFADGTLADEVRRFAREPAEPVLSVRRVRCDGGRADLLLERIVPPPALLVFGAGSDADPLVRLAANLGWPVDLYDHRPALATRDRFPSARTVQAVDFERLEERALSIDGRSAAVVMTHHFLHDRAILDHLRSTGIRYIGLLGPRRRGERLIEEFLSGFGEHDAGWRSRVFGPTGLDIGAETPEEIALSVLAEIQAVLLDRGGGPLRERRGPLHEASGGLDG